MVMFISAVLPGRQYCFLVREVELQESLPGTFFHNSLESPASVAQRAQVGILSFAEDMHFIYTFRNWGYFHWIGFGGFIGPTARLTRVKTALISSQSLS